MPPRHRAQIFGEAPEPGLHLGKGLRGQFGSTIGGGGHTRGFAVCDDHTGFGDCEPFDVNKYNSSGGVLYKQANGFFDSWFYNYIADVLDNADNFPHLGGLSGDMDDVAFATQAVARTNPSKPEVDLVANILELGDISNLIRIKGRNILERIGSGNLSYQFGVRPLVDDIGKILDFQKHVKHRVAVIEALRTKRDYRKTVSMGTFSDQRLVHKVIQSAGYYVDGDFSVKTVLDVRAHCRWIPAVDLSYLDTPEEMRELARRALYSTTIDSASLWEAIPWSWLIDWCTTAGSYFSAQRNVVPALLHGVHIMRHTRTGYSWTGFTQPGTYGLRVSSINVERETKSRKPSFAAPIAHFPFLTGNQVGILASLAVTRM